jgi:hypothetical protein
MLQRHNENVMPLCINVIHHIVLTFESYLMNHQKMYIYIYIYSPLPNFFLGNLCGAGPVIIAPGIQTWQSFYAWGVRRG